MTEVEAWTLLVDFNTAGMNGMALYLTVASGYLIVAYLPGKQLTTYQVALISVMFVIFALLFTYGVIGMFDRANYFTTHIDQYAELSVRQRPLVLTIFGAMQIVGVLACLVFMWQVRHSKSE